jgi:hypothetical protein
MTQITVFTRLSKNVKRVAINFRGNRHLISFYERGFVHDILTVFSGRVERRQWDNGRGRNFGDEPSSASEKRV